MKNESLNLKDTIKLQNDFIFGQTAIVNLAKITGMPTRKGLEQAVISEGQIVNIVSNSYGHLPNDRFFMEVERKLIDADINYVKRSINRENRSFAVDYILQDERYVVRVKNGKDKLKPMLRFVNSYDGSCKTSGSFGFYREICSNGLHVSHTEVGFSSKHTGNIVEVVIPEIKSLVYHFMSNEYYTLARKFEVLAERPITNINEFVKITADHFKLFKFESSDKNPDPSANARLVIDTINSECALLKTAPNMWIGYNAFNDLLHSKLKKTFTLQSELDSKIFELLSK